MDLFNSIFSVVLHVVVFGFLFFYIPLSSLWRLFNFIFARPLTRQEDLRGEVVLITGASSGMGEQLAYQYAKRGASLVLTARRVRELKVVAEAAQVYGAHDVLVIPADISSHIESKRVVDDAIAHFGKLNYLIVNAGILCNCLFEEITNISAFTQVMDVNFWGAVHPTYFAIPQLKKSRGKIVVMASNAGRVPLARMSFYNASKAALIRFYETLRAELGPDVKITILTPGWFSSEITKGKALPKDGETKFNEDVRDDLVGYFPVSHSENCAEAVLKAACRGDEYLTWPSWYYLFNMVMFIAPEVLNWLSRMYYVTKRGTKSSQTLNKKPSWVAGVKKLLYPSSIRSAETKLNERTD